MDTDLINVVISGLPNFAGFLLGYAILMRVVMAQHATINRCIDALVSRANCDDEHLEAVARRRIADTPDT